MFFWKKSRETGDVPPARQKVTPRECALAVGIPLTCEQYLSDLKRNDKDLAHHAKRMAQKRTGSTTLNDEYYWNYEGGFGKAAHLAAHVCDEVEKMGVTVVRAATLADMAPLLQKFPVVTVVTHWRFTRIITDDIRDAKGLLDTVRTPQNHVQEAMRRRLNERQSLLMDEKHTAKLTEDELKLSLVSEINAIMAVEHTHYALPVSGNQKEGLGQLGDDELQSDLNVASNANARYESVPIAHAEDVSSNGSSISPINLPDRLTRVAVERAFAPMIVPGRAVEFQDGMKSVEEVVNAIPTSFNGLLDLTICNSVLLAAAIKHSRPDCLVAANRYPAQLHIRMGLYRMIIRQLRRRPGAFMDTMSSIHAHP